LAGTHCAGGAEKAEVENTGVKKAGVDCKGGKCRSGKPSEQKIKFAVSACWFHFAQALVKRMLKLGLNCDRRLEVIRQLSDS